MYRKAVLGAALVVSCLMTNVSFAQNNLASELYGRGVHAYYASDFEVALKMLNESIEAEAADPRPYYFRGLVQASLGEAEKAAADFKQGAMVEVAATERPFNIGRALQRVQGPFRLDIEKERAGARLDAKRLQLKREAARYRDIKNAEGEVLIDPDKAPPAPPKAGEAPANSSDPFGDGSAAPPAADAPAADAPATTPPATTPPAATPAPGGTPPAADPFDTPAATPPANTPAADPFAPKTPAADTPAADTPAADPFAPKTPAADTPAADTPAADPFAPKTPAADTPAADTPAADSPAADGAAGAVEPTAGGASSLFKALLKVATPRIPTNLPQIPGLPGAGPGGPGAAPGGPPAGDPFAQPPSSDPFGAPGAKPPAGTPPAGTPPAGTPPASDPFKDDPAKPATDPFGTNN